MTVYSQLNYSEDLDIYMINFRIIKAMSVRERFLKGILKLQIHEAENNCYLWSTSTGPQPSRSPKTPARPRPRTSGPSWTPSRPHTWPQGPPARPTRPRTWPPDPPAPPTCPRTRWPNNWPWKSLMWTAKRKLECGEKVKSEYSFSVFTRIKSFSDFNSFLNRT